jgi:hypothetical protein
MKFQKHFMYMLAIAVAAIPLVANSQSDDRLCSAAMKPELAKLTLSWDSYNMFGNRKASFVETAYSQAGEGSSCKITSKRGSAGSVIERPCTWNQRMSCELQMGKDPITLTFNAGSYQRGKLQWVKNETHPVNVKRGEATAVEQRTVAVITFNGTWSNGADRGNSTSTIYYDREWGVMLKAEGAHDANKWGDAVTLVEIAP